MALKAVLSEDEFNELDEATAQNYEYSNEDGSYVLFWDVVKDHPGVQKVKKTANTNKKSAEQVQQERDRLRKKFGPLADAEDIDLSEYDDDQLEPVLRYLRGETSEPPAPSGGQGHSKDGQGKQVDVDKIKKNARAPLERERDEIAQERDRLRQQLSSIVVDNALTSAVSEIQVQGPYVKAVKAMFQNMVKVDQDENGNPTAVIEGEYGEQPVNKYLKDWAQTEEGRAFVAGNNGSGAPGGNADSGKYAQNPFSKEHWNVTEQARVSRDAPERARRMAAQAGRKAPV